MLIEVAHGGEKGPNSPYDIFKFNFLNEDCSNVKQFAQFCC